MNMMIKKLIKSVNERVGMWYERESGLNEDK